MIRVLPVLGHSTQTCGEVAYRADGNIARAFGQADLPKARVSPVRCLRRNRVRSHRGAKSRSTCRLIANAIFDRALCPVETKDRVAEDHHDPIAGELAEVPSLGDERSQCAMVFA